MERLLLPDKLREAQAAMRDRVAKKRKAEQRKRIQASVNVRNGRSPWAKPIDASLDERAMRWLKKNGFRG